MREEEKERWRGDLRETIKSLCEIRPPGTTGFSSIDQFKHNMAYSVKLKS